MVRLQNAPWVSAQYPEICNRRREIGGVFQSDCCVSSLFQMIHILVGEDVFQDQHGVKLAVSVPLLKLRKHLPDPAGILQDIDLALICFQNRILCAPCLRPVCCALILFCGILNDLFNAVHLFLSRKPLLVILLNAAEAHDHLICPRPGNEIIETFLKFLRALSRSVDVGYADAPVGIRELLIVLPRSFICTDGIKNILREHVFGFNDFRNGRPYLRMDQALLVQPDEAFNIRSGIITEIFSRRKPLSAVQRIDDTSRVLER